MSDDALALALKALKSLPGKTDATMTAALGMTALSGLPGLTVAPAVSLLNTTCYAALGDGGGGRYKRVASQPAHAGKAQDAAGAWFELDERQTWPELFGAKGDGSTMDHVAIQAAHDYLVLKGGGTLQLGPKFYAIGAALVLKPGVTIRGHGMGLTTLKLMVDGIGMFVKHGLAQSGSASLRDMTLWGYGDRNATQATGGTLCNVGPFNDLVFENLEVAYSRFFSLAGVATRAMARGCYVHHSLRDGINLSGSNHARYHDNIVDRCADDALSFHVEPSFGTTPFEYSCIATGNRFTRCTGMKFLGVRNATIANNVSRFCYGYALYMAIDGIEGDDAKYAISVANNSFVDTMNTNIVAGAGRVFAAAIYLQGAAFLGSGAAALPGLPGAYSATTGLVQSQAAIVDTQGTTGTSGNYAVTGPRGTNFGIAFTGNSVVNLLDKTSTAVNWSDMGYGKLWWTAGEVDPAMTSLVFMTMAFWMSGDFEAVKFSDNVCYGMWRAFYFSYTNVLRSIHCSNNLVFRCMAGYSIVPTTGVLPPDVLIDGGEINLDPLWESSLRTTYTDANGIVQKDGGWTISGANWRAIDAPAGVIMRNVKIRNCMQDTVSNTALLYDNVLYWDWSGTANAGIGNVNAPVQSNRHVFEYSNPSNTTNLVGSQAKDSGLNPVASAMPSTGYYLPGQFVTALPANQTVSNGARLRGWHRLTKGNTHVLGTDWLAEWVLTGAPATTTGPLITYASNVYQVNVPAGNQTIDEKATMTSSDVFQVTLNTRHDARVELMVKRNDDTNSWWEAREKWFYAVDAQAGPTAASGSGAGTSGVDYVPITSGTNHWQRNYSAAFGGYAVGLNGLWGSFPSALGTLSMTYDSTAKAVTFKITPASGIALSVHMKMATNYQAG